MISVYLHEEILNNRGLIIGKDKSELFLLNHGLHEAGALAPGTFLTEKALSRTPGGKPFLPDLPAVRFNFSHSGKYIALAISDSEVGLDLQETTMRHTDSLKIARRFFTEDEYRSLLSCDTSEEKNSLFCLLWTIKEAYLKYLGCGLAGRMDSFRPEPKPAPDRFRTMADVENMGWSGSEPVPVSGQAAAERGSENMGCTKPVPVYISGSILQLDGLFSDNDRIKDDLPTGSHPFPAAEYAVLPAPAGYALTVCARKIPDIIRICRPDLPPDALQERPVSQHIKKK